MKKIKIVGKTSFFPSEQGFLLGPECKVYIDGIESSENIRSLSLRIACDEIVQVSVDFAPEDVEVDLEGQTIPIPSKTNTL